MTKPKTHNNDNQQNAELDKQTLLQHLRALRSVFVVSLLSILVCFVIVFLAFSEELILFLSRPLVERGVDIVNIGLAEVFISQMRVSFVAGCILASPVVFWKIWAFLKPALFPKERYIFSVVFFVTMFLFVLGVMFAYFWVFNITVNFFLVVGQNVAIPQISLDMYLQLMFNFIIPFGIAFQFPVVIFFLHRMGIVTIEALQKRRKYIFFGMFVMATLLTPPDPLSQIMLAAPLYFLYEISIIVLKFTGKREVKEEKND